MKACCMTYNSRRSMTNGKKIVELIRLFGSTRIKSCQNLSLNLEGIQIA